jgi:hypothetical protein
MKRIISVALIILMSVQSFYKLGVITYFQLNREFIAKVLCINKEKPATMCHGQCFLKNKLDLAEKASDSPAPAHAGKEKIEFPTFIVCELSYNFQQVSYAVIRNTNYLQNSSSVSLAAPFHPPAIA